MCSLSLYRLDLGNYLRKGGYYGWKRALFEEASPGRRLWQGEEGSLLKGIDRGLWFVLGHRESRELLQEYCEWLKRSCSGR